ncbi:MAG: radical SAM family heme chaperone HemW [Magnetovibrionaceae bacterium]
MRPLSAYIHWPFCKAKCPYCDFNSHVAETIDHGTWSQAYSAEIGYFAQDIGTEPLTSVFFGGGTPSLMAASTVASVLERLESRFGFSEGIEITLEANPTSVEMARLADLRAAGVNRISLGIQALNDADLKALGREHSADEGLKALEAADTLFDRVSFDLIYARPDQSLADWEGELTRALGFGTGHLSVYQLTIEPGTQFHKERRKAAPEDLAADLFELTQEVSADAGLPAYEISNHAKPGEACRHNLVYWTGGRWFGIGPGAHSRLFDGETWFHQHQFRDPAKWLKEVTEKGHGSQKRTGLSAGERVEEVFMMGLRLTEGLTAEQFEQATDLDLFETLEALDVGALFEGGFLLADQKGVRCSSFGLERLDAVLARLLGR